MDESADGWHVWSPAKNGDGVNAAIARAVEEFEPLDHPAGRAATAWLKESALATHPYTLTYVYMLEGKLEGFFAIVSSSFALNQRDRRKLAPDAALIPTQGASLVAWLAKHRDAQTPGYEIVAFALGIANEVAEQQGTLAFVVDPFDDETAAMWMDRYEFRESATETGEGRRRLWTPLHSD